MNISEILNSRIDKSDWIQYKFSDFAENIVEKIVPRESGLEHYIGLEHLDAGSIKINRFGDPQSLKGDKLKIYKGDIIFAKRNAYLKRASLAEFDGVASAHSMVLRAIPGIILPEFFPFFMQSDSFWDVAIRISVGGLSPTINWKQMAKQEFLLPPKDQQAKIAELLWAMDDVVEKEKDVLEEIQSAYQVILEKIFSESDIFKLHKLKELATVNEESLKSSNDSDYEFKYLDIASIVEPKIIGEMKKMKFSDAPSRARRKLKDGSIVLSLVRPYHKAFVLVEKSKNIISSTGTAVINANGVVNNHFLFHQFFSNRFQLFCAAMMTGTNYPAITPSDLKEYKLYFCESIEEQNKIASKLNSFDNSVVYLKESIQQSKQLQKSLINEIFSE